MGGNLIGSMLGKGLALVLFIAFLGVVGGMGMLGTAGSIIIYNIMVAMQDWSELIGMGVALGLFIAFMPVAKKKLGL